MTNEIGRRGVDREIESDMGRAVAEGYHVLAGLLPTGRGDRP
jgi:hypothetical protein